MQKIKLRVNTSSNSIQLSPSEIRIVNAVSPTVDVERTEEGAEITVHDIRGTQSVEIYDGEQGPQGEPGTPGQPGRDGFSPTVDVTEIEGGHRVTITDTEGEHVFDVVDGSAGVHVVEYSLEGEEPTLVDATYSDISGWLHNNELVVLYTALTGTAYYQSYTDRGELGFRNVNGEVFRIMSDDSCEIIDVRYATEEDVDGALSEIETALEQLSDGKVDKSAIDDAGITAHTYTEKFGGEFTVTTATATGHLKPYARASVTGRIDKRYMHRVTVNGTVYELPTRLWYEIQSNNLKVYEYLGNLKYYVSDTSGVPGGTDNVPFLIISDLGNSNSIDVWTNAAGTYTILVEQIANTQKKLPNSLIYNDNYVPFEKTNSGGTYNGFSIGVNELNNTRGTFAVGYGNKVADEFSTSIGYANSITGNDSTAIGHNNEITAANGIIYGNRNIISEAGGIAIGYGNEVSGNSAVAIGDNTLANANSMVAIGKNNVAAVTEFPNWQNNTFYPKGSIFTAVYAPSASATAPKVTMVCIRDYTSAATGTFFQDLNSYSGDSPLKGLPSNGDTSFVIGNGSTSNHRSNALKVDTIGNTRIGGDLYVNCDPDSTGGTKVATETAVAEKYTKPATGIPSSDLASSVQTSLGNADTAYQKPSTGIPSTDLDSSAQTSLANADTAYQKPSTGIPASDLASGVIPSVPVQDVQVNGTSILADGVANVPVMSTTQFGVAKIRANRGILVDTDGTLKTGYAGTSDCKTGANNYLVITPGFQHSSAFYGFAKAAGDSTQSASSNAVGTYTDAAKVAIQKMLGVYREWELIADYTVSEDTIQLNILTDLNGQSFALSNMLVRAWLEPATTGTNSYVGAGILVVNTDNQDSTVGGPTKRYMANGAKTYFEYITDLMCGVCVTSARSGDGAANTSSVESISSPSDNNKYIRGFRLSRYSDTTSLIPAGSNIKIYGIRI